MIVHESAIRGSIPWPIELQSPSRSQEWNGQWF